MMLALIAALAASPTGHLPVCGGYVVPPSNAERSADAALVSRAAGHATTPAGIGTVMAPRDWRIIWATPGDSEPGVFFFRRAGTNSRLIDTWAGPTSDRDGARRWAMKTGAPAALAQCFANRLVEQGP